MDQFAVASSAVLDLLWQHEDFCAHFDALGYDLRAVAKLVPTVFRSAYLKFRAGISTIELEDLQQDAIDELMLQMVRNPTFVDVWRTWDDDYRDQFLEHQAEEPLGMRLAERYPEQAKAAYCEAFDAWLAENADED